MTPRRSSRNKTKSTESKEHTDNDHTPVQDNTQNTKTLETQPHDSNTDNDKDTEG